MQTQEAVKKYLLSKKNHTKLKLFQLLAKHSNPISHSYLAQESQLSESTLLVHLKELNQDLQQNIHPDCQVISKQRFSQLELGSYDQAECYYKMFGAYCRSSTNFTIIAALLNRDTNSILALSQKTNFSVPYLYSRMKAIDEFLALFGLAISFSKSGERRIIGTEVQIQYCLLDVYWTIFANTSLPFYKSGIDIHQFVSSYLKKELIPRLSSGQLDKIALLLILCTENFPYTSLEKMQDDLAKSNNNKIFLNPVIDAFMPSLNLSEEQRIILNILIRLSTTKIDSDEENYRQYSTFLQAKIPAVLSAKELIEHFSESFHLAIPENKKILHILNVSRNRLYNDNLVSTQPNTILPSYFLRENSEKPSRIIDQIRQFYYDFEENHDIWQTNASEENIEWIVEDLYHLYDRYHVIAPIRIGVNYTRDYYISDDIIGKIEQIFTANIILQKNEMQSCDLVISDCPLPKLNPDIKKIYMINDLSNKENFDQLIGQIAREIFDLINSRF